MSRVIRGAVVAVLALALLPACGGGGGSSSGSGKTVVVGSANFPENVLLAQIYAQALEAKKVTVDVKANIGARELIYKQIQSGGLSVLPEYNGALLAYLDPKATPKTVEATTAAIDAKLDSKLTLLDPASAQDKDSVTITKATADKYKLTSESSIADLKDIAKDLIIGASPESQTRQQGLVGLKSVYGLEFKSFKALDAGGPLTRAALKKNTVQAADLFTTDPVIVKEKHVVLQDPKNLFGFENVQPLVYKSGLLSAGTAALNAVSAKLDTKALLDLDSQVQLDNKDPLDVAKAWLKSVGLG